MKVDRCGSKLTRVLRFKVDEANKEQEFLIEIAVPSSNYKGFNNEFRVD
jgi:hypothetical protein